jgi:hypothetical protein
MKTFILKMFGSLFVTYGVHYTATKVYNHICVPDNFFQGLLYTGSPWCKLTLEIMTTTQHSYTTMITMAMSRFMMDLIP